jgi:hypothetical protein
MSLVGAAIGCEVRTPVATLKVVRLVAGARFYT